MPFPFKKKPIKAEKLKARKAYLNEGSSKPDAAYFSVAVTVTEK